MHCVCGNSSYLSRLASGTGSTNFMSVDSAFHPQWDGEMSIKALKYTNVTTQLLGYDYKLSRCLNTAPSYHVTSASSLLVFKNRLMTYLFRCCYETG